MTTVARMAARPTTGILVGPGTLENVDGVHALARAVGVAVINTWGAKGVFRWDDPFRGGTAGLQEHDFELAGLGEVDVLLTSGLDPLEIKRTPWDGRAEVVDIPVGELHQFATTWSHAPFEPTRPALYTELEAVVQPMYGDGSSVPGRLQAIKGELTDDGIVFAPPGLLGFWVARTWATTRPGSVVVPASTEQGLTHHLANEAARAGHEVTFLDPNIFPGDLTIPDTLLDVAGPLVAWT